LQWVVLVSNSIGCPYTMSYFIAFPSYRRRPKTKKPSQTNREGDRTEAIIAQASGDFDASEEVKHLERIPFEQHFQLRLYSH
jgi:hypothetical protein